MQGFGMFIFHYCKKKKKNETPYYICVICVTPIWKRLGQGSSLASLGTTFDTLLPPDPLKPPEVP